MISVQSSNWFLTTFCFSRKYKSSIFLCRGSANTKRNLKLCLMLCLNALTLIECPDPACHFVHSAWATHWCLHICNVALLDASSLLKDQYTCLNHRVRCSRNRCLWSACPGDKYWCDASFLAEDNFEIFDILFQVQQCLDRGSGSRQFCPRLWLMWSKLRMI